MKSRARGNERPLSGSKRQARITLKLASDLQRAINTGRASPRTLKSLDNLIGRRLTERARLVLQILDSGMRKSTNPKAKEELGLLYVQATGLLNSFKAMEREGYISLLQSDRSVDSSSAERLVDLDSEIIAGSAATYSMVQKAGGDGDPRKREIRDIKEGFRELRQLLEARESLLTESR